MRTITLALVIGTALAMLGSSLGLPPARAQREETVPVVSQPVGPVSRPDLALSLRDLPPGYEEAPSLDLALNDTPLHDRVIRRTRSGAGPEWIWTMTYQARSPVSQDRLTFLTDDLAAFLTRAMSDVASLSDWTRQDATGLGSVATLYTFKFRPNGSDLVGDGALALFGPGDYVSYLAVLNLDGQAASDLRMLARTVSARVDAQRAGVPEPR
jgi:hypothetical protein